MDRTFIEDFAARADVPTRAIAGLTKQDLNAPPPAGSPGKWTIQQIIVHLMDSHLIAADRMKRIIAEDNPTIIGYDETAFVQHLHYDKVDTAMATEAFRLVHRMMADLLRQLPDAAFARFGTHNERGRLTLEQMVTGYTEHVDHHMTFVREKRRLMGKPLAW